MALSLDAILYGDLLVKLAELQLADQRDEGAVDAIRDAMDTPWQRLSENERVLVAALSEDMYFLDPDERPTFVEPGDEEKARMQEFLRGWQRADWIQYRVELAQRASAVPSDMLLYVLSRGWEEQGFRAAAFQFMYAAHKLANWKSGYAVTLVRLSWALSHYALAADIGRFCLERYSDLHEQFREYVLSMIVAYSAFDGFDAEAYALQLRDCVHADYQRVTLDVRLSSIAFLAFYYERTERRDMAEALYNRAMAIAPENALLLASVGMFTLSEDRERAYAHMRESTQLNVSTPWPYLVLGRQALLSQQFEEAQALCLRGLQCSERSVLRARFLEWLALCSIGLERPPEETRYLFLMAYQFAPGDVSIDRNWRVFESSEEGMVVMPDSDFDAFVHDYYAPPTAALAA